MPFRRLIFTTLAALCLWLPTSVSAATAVQRMEETIARTDNRPQWHDLGMTDLLAVTNTSTLTPPPTENVGHDSPTGTASAAQSAQARHYSVARLLTRTPSRSVSGYIYLIRCLRL